MSSEPSSVMVECLVLEVPLLKEEPAVGSGCCALLAEDLIRDWLERVARGVRVTVQAKEGRVLVRSSAGRLNLAEFVEELTLLGYPPARVDPCVREAATSVCEE